MSGAKLVMVVSHASNPTTISRCEFKASLNHRMKPYLKIVKKGLVLLLITYDYFILSLKY